MTDRYQVDLFLRLMRAAAKTGFRFERRPENMATLAELEITVADAKSRILRLTADDYYRGPRPRAGHSIQEAWEFGLQGGAVQVPVRFVSPAESTDPLPAEEGLTLSGGGAR